MEQGPRQKPLPPPLVSAQRPAARPAQGANPAPSTEGIAVKTTGIPVKLMERMRALLPPALQGSLAVDVAGNVMAGGKKIGVQDKSRFLIDHGPIFSHIAFPPVMRAMAQSGKMIVFIEVTESEASICAGDVLGQKKIYCRIS